MAEIVRAVYEHGILRPLTPLDLPEHSQVELEVRTIPGTLEPHVLREQVRSALDAAGILAPATASERPPLSETERAALADRLAVPDAKPLSRIIMEDRDER